MKIKKYTNGAWTDLDKPVKKFDTYTDEATTLPLTIQTSATDAVENYQVYGTSAGAGVETGNLWNGNITAAWIGLDGSFNFDSNSSTIIIECDPESEYAIKKFSETDRFRVISYASSPSQAMQGTVLYSDDSANEAVVSTQANAKYLAVYIKSTYSSNEKATIISSSTPPDHYIPPGYKLPLTVESGETKCEKIAGVNITPNGVLDIYGAADAYSVWVARVKAGETCSVTTDETFGTNNVILGYFSNYPKRGDITIDKTRYLESTTFKALYTGYVAFRSSYGFEGGTIKASSDIPIYIGDSKLGEEEFVDFGEQKIYKMSEGTLVPTDPPVPLPAITTYIGENNISVDTTVQPEKVAVEYEGWKGVGDVEKYQNGEWSDNNGT